MAKRGRPTNYKTEYGDLARKLCMLGATDADLARLLDVAVGTIAEWAAGVPEFAAAVQAGREIADASVAERLYARAIGYSHPAVKIFQSSGEPLKVDYTEHYPPDVQACVFWLRNRRRQDWRDKIEHEQTAASELMAELDAAGERVRNVRG